MKSFSGLIITIFIYVLNRNNEKNKESKSFISELKKNIIIAKNDILTIEKKSYTQQEKITISEKFRDLFFYLGYEKEKEKHLNKHQQSGLFNIQSDIEDYVGSMLVECDFEINQEHSVSILSKFIEQL
jgi:hypothetical protein